MSAVMITGTKIERATITSVQPLAVTASTGPSHEHAFARGSDTDQLDRHPERLLDELDVLACRGGSALKDEASSSDCPRPATSPTRLGMVEVRLMRGKCSVSAPSRSR